MNVNVEKLPQCLVKATTEFSAETVSGRNEKLLKTFASEASLPGFRPGKAPRRVIEKRFKDAIQNEMEYELLSEFVQHLAQEEKIDFLNIKDREITHKEDGGMEVVLTMITPPVFDLPEYKGIKVSVPDEEVTEEEIEAEILRLQQQSADYPTKEEGSLEKEEIAVISYTSLIDGQAPAEVFSENISPYDQSEEYWIKANAEHFLPGFSENLLAMVPGSEKTFDYTFPADFQVEDLKEKTFTYTVSLKEIKEEKLPEVAELAQKLIGEEADEDLFREQVSTYAQQQKEKNIYSHKVDTILDTLAEGLDFDLPAGYLEAETQSQADHLVKQSVNYGIDEEAIMGAQDSIAEQAEKDAHRSLRNHFILTRIADEENLTVEPEEIKNRLMIEALQSGQDPQKALKTMDESAFNNKKQMLIMDKVVDFLVNEAEVTVEKAED